MDVANQKKDHCGIHRSHWLVKIHFKRMRRDNEGSIQNGVFEQASTRDFHG